MYETPRTGGSGDGGSTDPDRVELFVRSLAPQTGRTQQESIVERLAAIEERGVADTEVHLCGNAVCARAESARTDAGQFLIRRLAEFEAWADDADRELSGFEEHDVDSSITGARLQCVAFPRVVMAEYCDGEVQFVAPSTDGDEVTTVSDRLDAIERRVLAGPA